VKQLTGAVSTFAWLLFSAAPLLCQHCPQRGPWPPSGQDKPALKNVEISTAFTVKDIIGNVYYGEGKPLQQACIEIVKEGRRDEMAYMNFTDREGRFAVRTVSVFFLFWRVTAVPPGTYRFKVTKEGFHPTVGTVVVSPKAPKQSDIKIELKPDEGYLAERGKELVPNEQLIPLSDSVPVSDVLRHKQFPERNSVVYMPVSLALGRVRTPEFPVEKQYYEIILQLEKPLSFQDMNCMLGSSLFPEKCGKMHSLLRADWTVWDSGHLVHWGSTSERSGCIWTAKNIFACLGRFPAEAGKKYVVQLHFTEDGTPLNVANPLLIVIQHRHMFSE
jgi:hypothetical protein